MNRTYSGWKRREFTTGVEAKHNQRHWSPGSSPKEGVCVPGINWTPPREIQFPVSGEQDAAKTRPRRPKTRQDAPKTLQRAPKPSQDAPKTPQDAPKPAPRRPKTPPRRPRIRKMEPKWNKIRRGIDPKTALIIKALKSKKVLFSKYNLKDFWNSMYHFRS